MVQPNCSTGAPAHGTGCWSPRLAIPVSTQLQAAAKKTLEILCRMRFIVNAAPPSPGGLSSSLWRRCGWELGRGNSPPPSPCTQSTPSTMMAHESDPHVRWSKLGPSGHTFDDSPLSVAVPFTLLALELGGREGVGRRATGLFLLRNKGKLKTRVPNARSLVPAISCLGAKQRELSYCRRRY